MSEQYITGKIITLTILKSLQRLNGIEDPVIRYRMFLETIQMASETGLTYVNEKLKSDLDDLLEAFEDLEIQEFTEDVKKRKQQQKDLTKNRKDRENIETTLDQLDKMNTQMNKYLDGFIDWVQQPIYSPDHPLGEKMMKSSQQDFSNHSNE